MDLFAVLFCFSWLVGVGLSQTEVLLPPPVINAVDVTEDVVLLRWRVDYAGRIDRFVIIYTDQGRTFTETALGREREFKLFYIRPCQEYTVQIKYSTPAGASELSQPYPFRGYQLAKPPPPVISVEPHGLGRVIRWTPDDAVYQIYKYNIIGREKDGEVIIEQAPEDVNEMVLDGFHFIHEYNVTMTAENFCWQSDESTPVHVEIISELGAPVVSVVNTTETAVHLRIAPHSPTDRVDYYFINYTTPSGYQELGKINGDTENVTLEIGLEACFNHTITVTAVNPAGESAPRIITAMLSSERGPQPPKIAEMTQLNDDYIVHWTVDSVLPLVSHRVKYHSGDGILNTVWAGGEARSANLGRLTKCRVYKIELQSENHCGWSPMSDPWEYEVFPMVIPDIPVNLTHNGDTGEFTMMWNTANITEDVENYELLVVDGQGPARSYLSGGSKNSLVLKNLQVGGTYNFRLSARNACGWSQFASAQFDSHRF